MPDAFQDILMSTLLDWSPDVGGHSVEAGLETKTYAEVRRAFAMSPFMVHCWACLADHLAAAELEILLVCPTSRMMAIYRDYELAVFHEEPDSRDPEFPPGPRILYDLYQAKGYDCTISAGQGYDCTTSAGREGEGEGTSAGREGEGEGEDVG